MNVESDWMHRVLLPLKKILLPASKTSEPIPTLSDRQFVVDKSGLTSRQESAQRELFWYREEVYKCIKARWREVSETVYAHRSN